MAQVLIEKIMTRDVTTVPPDCAIADVVKLMHDRRISCVVVARRSEPLGVITERDIVRLFGVLLKKGVVPQFASEAMSAPPITVYQDTAVTAAMAVARARAVRHVPVLDANDRLVGIVTQTDLIDGHRKELERRTDLLADRTRLLLKFRDDVEALSFEDKTLEIGNRRAMEVVLEHTHRSAARYGREYSVVMFGLDHLETYRLRHGEDDASLLLHTFSTRIGAEIRRSDQIYRMRNNIFLALLPEASLRGALLVADRSKNLFQELFGRRAEEDIDRVNMRIGVATFKGGTPDDPQDWHNVLLRAEYSLSQTKASVAH